jgi:hypothetical protein
MNTEFIFFIKATQEHKIFLKMRIIFTNRGSHYGQLLLPSFITKLRSP